MRQGVLRRTVLSVGSSFAAGLALAACGTAGAPESAPNAAKKPVKLTWRSPAAVDTYAFGEESQQHHGYPNRT